MYVLNENYCYVVIILPFKLFITFTLIYHYLGIVVMEFVCFFLILIGHLVNYINTYIFIIYFEILCVGSILLIVF